MTVQIRNPWQDIPLNEPFVLPDDRVIVDKFNASAPEEFKLNLEILPEPFVGRPEAPVVLLNLNPRVKFDTLHRQKNPDFKARSRGNLVQSPVGYPFFLLDPELSTSLYWRRKLKRLIDAVGIDVVGHNVLCVEYFPYHSTLFRHGRIQLQSQQYGFNLVRQAIDRQAIIVLLRSERLWYGAVQELAKYSDLYKLRSPQNITISAKNCPDGFERIVKKLSEMR